MKPRKKRRSISKSITTHYLALAGYSLIISAVCIYAIVTLSALNQSLFDEHLDPMGDLLALSGSIGDIREDTIISVLDTQTAATRASSLESWNATNLERMKALETGALGDQEQLRAYQQMSSYYKTMYSSQLELISMVESGLTPDDLELVEGVKAVERASDDLAAHINDIYSKMMDKAHLGQENARNSANFTAIIAGVVCVMALILAFVLHLQNKKNIVAPIKQIGNALNTMARSGDLQIKMDAKLSERADELGDMANSLADAMRLLQQNAGVLEQVARGDLTVYANVRSADDILAISINDLVTKLNTLFSNISAEADHVAASSMQVSEGSQSLAQGTTEQASAIQELSASINHISTQSQHSAQQAQSAHELTMHIRQNALDGNVKMSNLVAAVQEIDAACNSISKIIKVIDEIAFQTNLLALNAAVEAAQAGQHGRGFAVVAEEVKTLATRSSNAAKETNDLIANSITKAQEGVSIARGTEDALHDIVTSISNASDIIAEIAAAASNEAASILQITQGVEQVSDVVQLNSATSEESASASAEMSNIASDMKEMISVFIVRTQGDEQHKEQAAPPRSLHSPSHAQPKAEAPVAAAKSYNNTFGKY